MLVTISDKKLGYSSNDSTVDYFNPQVVSAQDYYPFGMLQPGREFNVSGYRYGFNGKENDNEVKGEGNQQDYGRRIYDVRIGRFLSVDPLQTQYPELTPYQFSGNTPIQAIDLDGLEPKGFMSYWQARTEAYMTRWGYTVQDFYDYQTKQVWTVMNYPNKNEYYYWETKYENAQRLFKPENTNLNKQNGEWTGKFKEFTPKLLSQDRSLHYAMVSMLASPLVAMGVIEGSSAAIGALESYGTKLLTDVAIKGIFYYYRYAPAAGVAGRTIAEIFDESGTVGAQNAALTKYAFGFGPFAEQLADQIGGKHLMNFSGDWKEEFKRIAGDASSEIHFDLTDLTQSGEINFEELSDVLSKPVSNTQWELSTLYSEFYSKFKETIFHFKGKEYKGSEIFNIKE